MKLRTVLLLLSVVAVIGALAWGAIRIVRATTATTALELPTTRVKHGRVTLTVALLGALIGAVSMSGSLIAWAKLSGVLSKPFRVKGQLFSSSVDGLRGI